MALFGSSRDVSFVRRMNRELMGNIISQQCAFYKYRLAETKVNMYGEASEGKYFDGPVLFNALITVGDNSSPTSDLGVDFDWPITFAFLRDDLPNPLNPGLSNFGYNVSVTCETHYVPADRINLQRTRL